MIILLAWMQQFPQSEFYFSNKIVIIEKEPVFNFTNFDRKNISCFSNTKHSQFQYQKPDFTQNIPKLIDSVMDDINITSFSDTYFLHFNKTIFNLNFSHFKVPQFQKLKIEVNYNGEILSQEQSWMYAVAGLVQIQGVKHQKYQLFENEQPVDLDLEEFAKYQKDLDIIRPRTTYWRQQQDYYQTNKMAFKNRLIDSQVEHVYITQFNFDDIVVQIIGVCMPNFSNSNQMNCEIVNFSSIGDKVEITLGCQRLCQIERLYQSVFRNSLSVDLNICQ